MNVTIISSLINGATALYSEYLRHRPLKTEYPGDDRLLHLMEKSTAEENAIIQKVDRHSEHMEVQPPQSMPQVKTEIVVSETEPISESPKDNKATSIVTGCIPCATGHLSTCSGLLKEAVRFGQGPEGVSSPEVVDRVNLCLDELNSMERVDMSPSMIHQLPPWERELAHQVLAASRATRHELEDVSNFDRLEEIAAKTDTTRKDIGRKWFQAKLSNLSEQDKAAIQQRVADKLNELREQSQEEG